jgi:hypothetical protein
MGSYLWVHFNEPSRQKQLIGAISSWETTIVPGDGRFCWFLGTEWCVEHESKVGDPFFFGEKCHGVYLRQPTSFVTGPPSP